MDSMGEILLQQMTGRNKEEFLRDAQLLRNPEGYSDDKCCPTCKKPIVKNEKRDMFCSNFSLDYKRNGKCCWHRYANGLNYWSPIGEVVKMMEKKLKDEE